MSPWHSVSRIEHNVSLIIGLKAIFVSDIVYRVLKKKVT